MKKNNERDFLNESIRALRSKEYPQDFENDYLTSLDNIVANRQKLDLAIKVYEELTKKQEENPEYLSVYPSLLASLLLIDRHYDVVKDKEASVIDTLAYSTFYLTGNKTDDMIDLFGDGELITKIKEKTKEKSVILNAMGNFLGQYLQVRAEGRKGLKQNLISFTESSSKKDLASLEPLYSMNEELRETALNIILQKPDKGGQAK